MTRYIVWFFFILTLCISILGCCPIQDIPEQSAPSLGSQTSYETIPFVVLRWYPTTLHHEQIHNMVTAYGFYEGMLHPESDLENSYVKNEIQNDIVIMDTRHHLMWASGILLRATYQDAPEVLATLHYAGYHDWRLPTLEELISLLETAHEPLAYYYNPIFSDFHHERTISADTLFEDNSHRDVWGVTFVKGTIERFPSDSFEYILPVRSSDKLPVDSKTGASIRGLPKDW